MFSLCNYISGDEFDGEDNDHWYSKSTSAATSVASSEYSDDGLIDIEGEAFHISPASVSITNVTYCHYTILMFLKVISWLTKFTFKGLCLRQ